MKKLVVALASAAVVAAGCGTAAVHGSLSTSRTTTVTTLGAVHVQPAAAGSADLSRTGRAATGSSQPDLEPPRGSTRTLATPAPAAGAGAPLAGDRCNSLNTRGALTPGQAGHHPLPMCAPA
ncbi:MAG TPA: hypothetical protein VET65_13400 [Candidatus Limnocylindrales bacterium]|nr:hypothetical protein [Candidatus Limnocylindrales bacterium]